MKQSRNARTMVHKSLFATAVFIILTMTLIGQTIATETSILYLHPYGKGPDQSGTLTYTPPIQSAGDPTKAQLCEYWPIYIFTIQADYDTTIPSGTYIFNLWIKADNDQRILVSLGCRTQTMQTNFGAVQYEVQKNAQITEYSFNYPLQDTYKIYKGEWFYADIRLGTGLTLYINHQKTPSAIITPTRIAIPEFHPQIATILVFVLTTFTAISLRKTRDHFR